MNINSQIFVDGGDPQETREADKLLKSGGFAGVQGQTTNPSLIGKRLVASIKRRVTNEEALEFYKNTVIEIAQVTGGPISIQVIADSSTAKEEMLRQARIYKTWIPNGVVKFPCTGAGLSAAEEFCREWSVNITLNFSQEQAAAVYGATRNAKYQVFISPFVGRLDDKGENGMDLVKNILQMYQTGDGHVRVLTASVRTLEHLLYAIYLKSPAITVPFKILREWQQRGFKLPDANYNFPTGQLAEIKYKNLDLSHDWHTFNLHHELTDVGLKKFMEDWRHIIGQVPGKRLPATGQSAK